MPFASLATRAHPDLRRYRVLDGGMATELERRGLDLSGPLWSASVLSDAPEQVEAVHMDYLRAGADILLTASYQASSYGYAELGIDNPEAAAASALRQAVEIAVRARTLYRAEDPRPVLTAASLGPYGAALHNGAEFHGNYDISWGALVDFHSERLAVLASSAGEREDDARPDLVAFETVPSYAEAEAILYALSLHPELPAWISFTCRDAAHTAHGERLRDCAALLGTSPEVAAIGINCTAPGLITPLIAEVRAAEVHQPILVYPNSGEQWDGARRCWTGTADVAGYAELAREWFAAGAQLVGGCCRTGPDHIRAVRAAADKPVPRAAAP
jgi:homocysteine S-methyltransferase